MLVVRVTIFARLTPKPNVMKKAKYRDLLYKVTEDLKTVRQLEHLLLLPKLSTENSGTIKR